MILIYRILWLILSPLLVAWFIFRLCKGKEHTQRFLERFGFASKKRPEGKLIWFHCASVGESLSILALIEELRESHKSLNILITTGTVTSAELMAKRLPNGVIHQFVPLDNYFSVLKFMSHWQPDFSIFVESEFWPEMLTQAPNPILINARVSDKSASRYEHISSWVYPLMCRFKLALTQTDLDRDRLHKMGLKCAQTSGNLKFDALPLNYNQDELKHIKALIKARPVWVCGSTHEPEETLIATSHINLAKKIKGLITIIIPRHPHRGGDIARTIKAMGLNCAQRSLHETLNKETDIYIADSLGEMGLFYSLANAVTMGGSLVKHGGQNPLEPLKLGKVTLTGPYMYNFRKMMQILLEKGIVHQTNNAEEMEEQLFASITQSEKRQEEEKKILETMAKLEGATSTTHKKLSQLIDKE